MFWNVSKYSLIYNSSFTAKTQTQKLFIYARKRTSRSSKNFLLQLKQRICITVSLTKISPKSSSFASESKVTLRSIRIDNDVSYFRDKAISSLQVILQKFDVEVGDERTNELKELCDTFNQQKEEFLSWQRQVCDPQIKLWVELRRYILHISY